VPTNTPVIATDRLTKRYPTVTALDQLTVDHSLVQEMIDQGELHPDDARNRQPRNVITRAMGAEGSVPDYWLMPVITGERLLIASDGLFTEVPDPAIAQRLGSGLDPQLAARTLVEDALAAGGRDNVTVIVLDVVAGGVAGPGEGSGQ
jgi:protein phosphatase